MNEWLRETYHKFGEQGVEDEKATGDGCSLQLAKCRFSSRSLNEVTCLTRDPLFLGPPLTKKGWQGSLLAASLHCAPGEGRGLPKPPKQARADADKVLPVLEWAMSKRTPR